MRGVVQMQYSSVHVGSSHLARRRDNFRDGRRDRERAGHRPCQSRARTGPSTAETPQRIAAGSQVSFRPQ